MSKNEESPTLKELDMDWEEIWDLLKKVREVLGEEAYKKLLKIVQAFETVKELIREHGATIRELRRLLFGASTEKRKNLFKEEEKEGEEKAEAPKEKKKRKGHGRHGAEDFPGAKKVEVPHDSLKPGDPCPKCGKGRVYDHKPGVIIRFHGQPPVEVTVYRLQKLRCNLCGEIFTAKAPEGVGEEKYDAATGAMIGLLKYGSGMPFNRLQALQGALGVPLAGSTQWEILEDGAGKLLPIFQELIRQGAQGEVLHDDDTVMRVRTLLKKLQEKKKKAKSKKAKGKVRTGIYTTGVVSLVEGKKVVLFFTGNRYAGENLKTLLEERARDLGPPILMCDGLDRNHPKDFQVLLANCLAHGRRKFVSLAGSFPEETRFVIDKLAEVYKNEEEAKREGMSPEERLAWHQERSAPHMEELKKWMKEVVEEKKVEPNSRLGKAIQYMEDRWEAMTLFLREPGAPLDNNVTERALKKAILHRKNSYFYQTENGARVGDLYMSLLYTAQENGLNIYAYLKDLLEHSKEVAADPKPWLPWNWTGKEA